ncbi:MAG: large-conductance mechanosensitive channel protein MscL [Acidiferrobacterales bacterium]
MFQEFKKFAIKGNVMDMAVGIIIGAAFGSIVSSFVADVIIPPIGLLLGGVDFSEMFLVLKDGAKAAGPYATLAAAKEAGAVSINIGVFINTIINFLIVAFAIFIVVKWINSLKKKEEEAPSEPPKPSNEEMLLGEIRDLLAK